LVVWKGKYNMRNRVILIGAGLLLGLAAIAGITIQRTALETPIPATFSAQAAQTAPGVTMGEMLTTLNDDGTLFTIDFGSEVPRLGKSVDINAGNGLQINRIGADMLCFDTRNNNNTQITCVPFSNINAVFYGE
jgi:hypothetical protein